MSNNVLDGNYLASDAAMVVVRQFHTVCRALRTIDETDYVRNVAVCKAVCGYDVHSWKNKLERDNTRTF